jgi:hypothetical protein
MPRLAAFGDHKAVGSNNKREAKQLLKENKVKEVQLRKYPQIQASKSKYLFFYEGQGVPQVLRKYSSKSFPEILSE